MTPERWAQIEELFHRAAECEPERRTALLDEACQGDPELRREVEALLACDRGAGDYVHAAVRSEFDVVGFPLTGQIVSHYRILDGLGGGGMGLLYRAEDIKLGRQVALKFLPEESAKDPVALGRFKREARAASALEHPNICPIYEFGEHEGQPFLVMQLLEGKTLQELTSEAGSTKPPLDVHKLLDLAIQITQGLEAAHRQGIVHRDIKPANIFVTTQGQAKILDFGLAKLAPVVTMGSTTKSLLDGVSEISAETAVTTHDLFLSRTGAVMGTAGYMSPEQVRGENLDARTDLFSFGLVLYEMATGKRAFTGDTWPALQEAILRRTPDPVRRVNPEVPAKLEAIIKKALEKNREGRYQAASEMRTDLETLQRQVAPKRLSLRSVLVAGGVILLLTVGVIFWFAKYQRSPSTALPDLKLRQLTMNSSEIPVKTGAISPDGKYLAYTDIKGLHIKLLETGETQSVPQPEGLRNDKVDWEIMSTAWFPDSTRFLVDSHPTAEGTSEWSSQTTSIWTVSVLGGPPRKLRDKAVAWSVSPDGSSISFGTNRGTRGEREIWLTSPGGEQSRKLYEAGEQDSICCLYFFPNGQRVSYIATDRDGDSLLARDLKGGPVSTLLRSAEIKKMGDGAWLPDGRLIYSDPCPGRIMRTDEPCNYWIMGIDVRSGAIVEKPRRLTNWVGVWMNQPSTTADGKRVAFLESSGRGVSYVADLKAGGTRLVNSRRFTMEEGGEDAISGWTTDSKTVIVVAERGDHYTLYRQSLDTDARATITSGAGLLGEADVSPDGKWVIMLVFPRPNVSTRQPLMRVPITGGLPELIFTVPLNSPFFCSRPPSNLCAIAEQSEDGKQMTITAFDPIKGRGLELARFDIDPDYDYTNENTLLWNISPEGSRIVAARGPEGPIQIRSLRGQPTQVIRTKGLKNMRELAWASDGKGLFVSQLTTNGCEILHLDLQGNAKRLWNSSGGFCFGGSSPDGLHMAIYEWKQNSNFWTMENF